MFEILREYFPKDIAQYICSILRDMYFKEWRQRIADVHSTLDVSMYCVILTIDSIKLTGNSPIVGSEWNGGYRLIRYRLQDGTLRGLEVHAIDVGGGHHEDVMCVECGDNVNSYF